MLRRFTTALALISFAINTAYANSHQAGIAAVAKTTLKESILLLSIAIPQLVSRPRN
jgi:adhesin transport system outer membrane protein